MARWTGFFNSSGSPALKISLCGAAKQVSKEFEAVVDTGFTGFLAMSMVEAFPLGLILTGSSKTILADGSATNDLTALGTVVVRNEERVGTILLSAATGAILVGMEFLTTFEKTLFVCTAAGSPMVVLMDNSEFKQLAQKEAPKGAPPATGPAPAYSFVATQDWCHTEPGSSQQRIAGTGVQIPSTKSAEPTN